MSSVLGPVEIMVARARRAFARSRRIIDAAKDDLESHQRWMVRHRAAWAEAAKRSQTSLAGKRASPVLILSLAIVAVALVAAGTVRGTISERSAETPMPVSRMPDLTPPTVSDAPRKITRPSLSPSKASGFRVAGRRSALKPLSMPPETVAVMVKMANPLTSAPPTRVVVTASAEGQVSAPKTSPTAEPKRRVLAHQPQPLPWLRQQPADHRPSPGAQRESRKHPWFRQLPWIEVQ
jgi:hypothetical protein